jgi:hypothetical protein
MRNECRIVAAGWMEKSLARKAATIEQPAAVLMRDKSPERQVLGRWSMENVLVAAEALGGESVRL